MRCRTLDGPAKQPSPTTDKNLRRRQTELLFAYQVNLIMKKSPINSTNLFEALLNFPVFCEVASGLRLRSYQRAAGDAILDSIFGKLGMALVVILPRQSGKNELQAQLECFLLACLHKEAGEMIKISPTFKPQTVNAMQRLERVLRGNAVIQQIGWKKENNYTYRVGKARVIFLSGQPGANIVGATASTLLEVDEAQDVDIMKFDKDVNPMAASTNATKVFWGTAWTSQTLLAREYKAALAAEQADGVRRVWRLTAEEVGREVKAYKEFVAAQVQKLGRNHPLVKTQFFSEDIDAEGGMFPPARRAMMQGEHAPALSPVPGKLYAVLLDVAGEDEDIQSVDEQAASTSTRRDATALTVVEVDLSTLADPVIAAPRYLVVQRRLWIGVKQSRLYKDLRGIVDHWKARFVVVDATGVGAGLSSFLEGAYPGKVLPFVFSSSSKSQLGWDFLGVIESGRFKDHLGSDPMQARFFGELEACQMEVQTGTERRLKWGVPNGFKDQTGDFIHDDLILSAALCAVLDGQEWAVTGPALVVQGVDPLKDLDHGY